MMHWWEMPVSVVRRCLKADARDKYKDLVVAYEEFRSVAKRTSPSLQPALRDVLAHVDIAINDAKQKYDQTACTCTASDSEPSTLVRGASWVSQPGSGGIVDDVAVLLDVDLDDLPESE